MRKGENMFYGVSDQRGMTLLELMIVIAIVGILAAIATPAFNNQVMEARRADARNSLLIGNCVKQNILPII